MEDVNVNGSSGSNLAPSDLKPFVQPPPKTTFKQAGIVPDPRLEAGKQLPAAWGANKNLIGIPLQDPDRAYDGFDTFIVLTDRSGTITRFSAHKSMSIFSPSSPLRLSAISILNHWLYAWLIAVIIIGNYWTRQMMGTESQQSIVTISEAIFISACIFELITKFIAYGVAVGTFTTMRSPWAWLDLLFILTGILLIWWPTVTLFRAIAALRTLKIIPATSQLLSGFRILIRTKERLFDVLIYAVPIIIGLALVGRATYPGLMQQKCIERMDASQHFGATEWHAWNRNPSHWLMAEDDQDEFFVCGNETLRCPPEYQCLPGYGTPPNHGYTLYDSFGWSALATVRIIAQDAVEALYMHIPVSSELQQLLYFAATFFVGTWAIVSFGFAITASVVEENGNGGGAGRSSSSLRLPQRFRARANAREDEEGARERPPSSPLRNWARRVVTSSAWNKFIVLVSILVLIFFVLYHHRIEERSTMYWILRGGLTALLCMYIVEAYLQLIADGCRAFACSPLHVYESIMVKLILAKFFQWYVWDFGPSPLDTALFTLPIVKLSLRWRALRTVFKVIAGLGQGYSFLALGILATLVLGEVGMLLFRSDYTNKPAEYFPRGRLPRWNFVDLPHAWLMVGRVTAGEWIQSLYACLRIGNVTCLPYFIATLFIMYLILMHVNVAIVQATVNELSRQEQEQRAEEDARDGRPEDGVGEGKLTAKLESSKYLGWIGAAARKRRGQVLNYEDGADRAGAVTVERGTSAAPIAAAPKGLHIPQNGCFVGFQDSLHDIYSHYAFRTVSILNVVVSCMALAADDVHADASTNSAHNIRIASRVVNIVFVVLLAIEVVVKLIGFGCRRYATRVECWLDTVMLAERVWSFFWFGFSTASHLNVVAGLRPLMFVFRIPQSKAAGRAIAGQVWVLSGYLLASGIVWLFFLLVAGQLYAGKMYACLDGEQNALDHRLIKNRMNCLTSNYTWANPPLNFDGDMHSVRDGLLSFLALATFSSTRAWTELVERAVDARSFDDQPAREYSMVGYAFFALFLLVGVLLLGNILLGVLVQEFKAGNMLKRLLTENQAQAREDNAEASAGGEIPRPESQILQPFFDFVTSAPFEPVLVVVLGADVACCLLYFILGDNSPYVLWIVFFWIFTFVYMAELGAKLLGWRCHMLRVYPNLLDIVAVAMSFIVGVLHFDLSVWSLRIFLRAIFLLKYVPFTLKRARDAGRPRSILLSSAARATPALTNLLALLVLLIATFALVGVAEFKYVRAPPAAPLNFQTFCNAMLVMVQLSMVAGWPEILLDYIGKETECDITTRECGNMRAGLIFIVVYTLLSLLVITNMFLVLVLEMVDQLRQTKSGPGQPSGLKRLQEVAVADAGSDNQNQGTQLQLLASPPPAPPVQEPQPQPQPRRESAITVDANGENPEAVVVVPS